MTQSLCNGTNNKFNVLQYITLLIIIKKKFLIKEKIQENLGKGVENANYREVRKGIYMYIYKRRGILIAG